MPKLARSAGLRRWSRQTCRGEPIVFVIAAIGEVLRQPEIDQRRAGEIETGKNIEIRVQPKGAEIAADISRPNRLLATLPVM